MSAPQPGGAVAVFGGYGHTAGFVRTELARRGLTPVLAGRDPDKLAAAAEPGWEVRAAAVEDHASLDRALAGTVAVVNCAGPFAETTPAVLDAAIRTGVHYVDITAESLVTLDTLDTLARYDEADQRCILPSCGFFGALGDLLATTALGDWPAADRIAIAVALDSWEPTRGTREAARRRAGRRVVFTGGRIVVRSADDPVPEAQWRFPEPFGLQPVVAELSTVDAVTISRHLRVRDIDAYLNRAPLADLANPDTPPPTPADASGRSRQRFAVDVVAWRGDASRRAGATGRDIYAVTAPIVGEALERMLTGCTRRTGIGTAGELFDAPDFLAALARDGHLSLSGDIGAAGFEPAISCV